jgi:hypothetical protein
VSTAVTFFPGSVSGIAADAKSLKHRSAKLKGQASSVASIGKVTSWDGKDAGAAKSTLTRLKHCLSHAASSYESAGKALSTFAGELKTCEEQYTAYVKDKAEWIREGYSKAQAEKRFEGLVAGLIATYWYDVAKACKKLTSDANEAHYYGGKGPFSTASVLKGTRSGVKALKGQVDLSDAGLDPLSVSQGQIGDCYLLSTIMSLENSAKGRAFIRSHVKWNASKDGYDVTLYINGKAHTYLVKSGYAQGAGSGYDHSANIATVYERAVGEAIGKGDLGDGGSGREAFELLTGKNAVYKTQGSAALAASALKNGDSVTAANLGGSVEVKAKVQDPGGSWRTETVDIVGGHQYAVLGTDKNGDVYVANPWGPANAADTGGKIRLTAHQFQSIFDSVEYGKL